MSDSNTPLREQHVDLTINRLTQARYNQLKSEGKLDKNQIYQIIDGNFRLDGHGRRISNVADPIATSDAATKNYVDANTAVKLDLSAVGMPNGTASLDAAGKLPLSQLPDTINSPHNHYKSEIVDFDHIHSKQDIADFEHTHKMNEITGLIEELDSIKFNEEEIFITEED